jgi:uncharacterized membrane protein
MRDADRLLRLVLTAWSCHACSLFLRLDGLVPARPGALALALSLGGFVVLAAAGWFGGRLVYTHGVGVREHGVR